MAGYNPLRDAPAFSPSGEEDDDKDLNGYDTTLSPGGSTGVQPQSAAPDGQQWLSGITGGLYKPAAQSAFQAEMLTLPDAPTMSAPIAQRPGDVTAAAQDWRSTYARDRAALGQGLAQGGEQLQYLDAVQRGNAGPSLAELQQRAGLESAQRQALGTALAGRGGTGAQIAAQRQQGELAAASVGDAARLRAAEQAQARDAYSAAIGQQQQAALGLGQLTAAQVSAEQQWAAQQLAAQQANQDAALQVELANQQAGLGVSQANLDAWLQARGIEASTYESAINANAQVAGANMAAEEEKRQAERRTIGQLASGAGKAIGGFFGLSDERAKRDLEGVSDEDALAFAEADAERYGATLSPRTARALERLPATAYRYREGVEGDTDAAPVASPGERVVGFTTQDLTRAGLGGAAGVRRGEGELEVFDVARTASTALAGVAAASREIRRLRGEVARARG